MDQLKTMKEQITSLVQGQLANVQQADTKELGEAVDMIKDLAEAIYYCSITEAMEEGSKEYKSGNTYYYTMPSERMYPYEEYNRGRMYYTDGGQNNGNGSSNGGNMASGGNRMYGGPRWNRNPVYYGDEREYEYMQDQMMLRDPREGRAKQSRRMYIESKEMHKDAATQMRELEKYIQDLSQDITEMIANATPEEKQVLQQKIATLATKIK